MGSRGSAPCRCRKVFKEKQFANCRCECPFDRSIVRIKAYNDLTGRLELSVQPPRRGPAV